MEEGAHALLHVAVSAISIARAAMHHERIAWQVRYSVLCKLYRSFYINVTHVTTHELKIPAIELMSLPRTHIRLDVDVAGSSDRASSNHSNDERDSSKDAEEEEEEEEADEQPLTQRRRTGKGKAVAHRSATRGKQPAKQVDLTIDDRKAAWNSHSASMSKVSTYLIHA